MNCQVLFHISVIFNQCFFLSIQHFSFLLLPFFSSFGRDLLTFVDFFTLLSFDMLLLFSEKPDFFHVFSPFSYIITFLFLEFNIFEIYYI